MTDKHEIRLVRRKRREWEHNLRENKKAATEICKKYKQYQPKNLLQAADTMNRTANMTAMRNSAPILCEYVDMFLDEYFKSQHPPHILISVGLPILKYLKVFF